MSIRLATMPFAALLVLSLSACGGDGDDDGGTPATVVDVAVANDLDTLVTAVGAAGLTDTLEGDGPFTVFAPSEAAFAALPDGALDALLADTDALSNLLRYHVVGDDLLAADVLATTDLATLADGMQ